MGSRLPLLLSVVIVGACGQATSEDDSRERAGSSATPPSSAATGAVDEEIASSCDFAQSSSRVVLAATVGPYGGKQEVYFVRANGTVVLGRTFGAERAESRGYIYIGDAKVTRHGEHLVATRDSDGASVFDLAGNSFFEGATAESATAFLLSRGVAVADDAPRITVETDADGTPVAVLRRPQEPIRVRLPDYRGEPYVRVESVRGDWALVGSYDADRSWRVNLKTADIAPMSKATPPGFQQFGAYQVAGARLYFTLDDDGGFLATLRDPYAGSVYHSPDGATGWTRIGSAARDVRNVAPGAQESGTYVIAGYTTGAETAPWAEPPAGYGPIVSGAFDELVRPSIGKRYTIPHGAISLTKNGRCAAWVGVSTNGVRKVSILDVGSGVLASPDVPVADLSTAAGVTLQWLP